MVKTLFDPACGTGGMLGVAEDHVRLTGYPDSMAFERIVVDQKIMAGVPCIRGTRIPVATVVGMVAEGMTVADIVADFPQLTEADIRDALQFAAAVVDQATIPLPAIA